ncbi:MAG: hypothetical protein CMF51_02155 [Legionellales bacterium]|nr:hypothetical protein [Legionellales bacterium]
MTLKLAAIGALGHMLSPAALHLSQAQPCPAQVVTVLDRGRQHPIKAERRAQWVAQGARCVDTVDDLLEPSALDGLVICAGKNGDDLPLIQHALKCLPQGSFILHCSTISPRCALKAYDLCTQADIEYVNWPLTGGPKGAQSQTMLILASGQPELYKRLQPLLVCLGQPHYFGDAPDKAAQIKLMNHTLVFSNLMGWCTATTCYPKIFNQPLSDSIDFFDHLNQGAGGSKQWELAIRSGLADQRWSTGFMVNHAVIDALYTTQLLIDLNCAMFQVWPVLMTASALALLIEHYGIDWGTHQLVQLFQTLPPQTLNAWFEHTLSAQTFPSCLNHILDTLPTELQLSCDLNLQSIL